MKTQVIIEDYIFAHKKTPAGFGCWAFCPSDVYSTLENYLHFCFWVSQSTYGDAKKKAVKHFTALAVPYITVCT